MVNFALALQQTAIQFWGQKYDFKIKMRNRSNMSNDIKRFCGVDTNDKRKKRLKIFKILCRSLVSNSVEPLDIMK